MGQLTIILLKIERHKNNMQTFNLLYVIHRGLSLLLLISHGVINI